MGGNTTVNLKVDADIKEQASEILESLGLTLDEAFNLMLHQIRIVRGLPFEIKQRVPIELNDGHGSYICEYGYLHDYSKFDFDAVEKEINSLSAKKYSNLDDMWRDLNLEEDNSEI